MPNNPRHLTRSRWPIEEEFRLLRLIATENHWVESLFAPYAAVRWRAAMEVNLALYPYQPGQGANQAPFVMQDLQRRGMIIVRNDRWVATGDWRSDFASPVLNKVRYFQNKYAEALEEHDVDPSWRSMADVNFPANEKDRFRFRYPWFFLIRRLIRRASFINDDSDSESDSDSDGDEGDDGNDGDDDASYGDGGGDGGGGGGGSSSRGDDSDDDWWPGRDQEENRPEVLDDRFLMLDTTDNMDGDGPDEDDEDVTDEDEDDQADASLGGCGSNDFNNRDDDDGGAGPFIFTDRSNASDQDLDHPVQASQIDSDVVVEQSLDLSPDDQNLDSIPAPPSRKRPRPFPMLPTSSESAERSRREASAHSVEIIDEEQWRASARTRTPEDPDELGARGPSPKRMAHRRRLDELRWKRNGEGPVGKGKRRRVVSSPEIEKEEPDGARLPGGDIFGWFR